MRLTVYKWIANQQAQKDYINVGPYRAYHDLDAVVPKQGPSWAPLPVTDKNHHVPFKVPTITLQVELWSSALID